jgi:hypothetical protein
MMVVLVLGEEVGCLLFAGDDVWIEGFDVRKESLWRLVEAFIRE